MVEPEFLCLEGSKRPFGHLLGNPRQLDPVWSFAEEVSGEEQVHSMRNGRSSQLGAKNGRLGSTGKRSGALDS